MDELAVLTGDIVASSRLGPDGLRTVFEALEAAAGRLRRWQGRSARLTRYRGDGWQAVAAPPLAFRAALALRAAVRATAKGHDTRIAVALGPGRIPGDTLADAEGPAFTASGRLLDGMPRRRRMSADAAALPLHVALTLADEIVSRWTVRQAEIAGAVLDAPGATQAELAARLGIAQQTLQGTLAAAGLDGLAEVAALDLSGTAS